MNAKQNRKKKCFCPDKYLIIDFKSAIIKKDNSLWCREEERKEKEKEAKRSEGKT